MKAINAWHEPGSAKSDTCAAQVPAQRAKAMPSASLTTSRRTASEHCCLRRTRSRYIGRLLHVVRACNGECAERCTPTVGSLLGGAAAAIHRPAAHPSAMRRGIVDWLRAAAVAKKAASTTQANRLAAIPLSRCAGERRRWGRPDYVYAAANAPLGVASCCGQVPACEAIRLGPAVLRH